MRRHGVRRTPIAWALAWTWVLGLTAISVEAQQPAGFQSLNPDISVIGDFLVDLSPDHPRFTEDGRRFGLREIELGLQAAVDPFFRADFFLGIHGDAIEVEEAYLTALALPGEVQARVGRFHLPMGKVNLTHRPELLTVEYPLAIRTYFSDEGFTGTGISASRIFAPFGYFQEIQLFVLNGVEAEGHMHANGHGHDHDDHDHADVPQDAMIGGPDRTGLEQVAFLAHLRQFHELSPAANLELGLSAATGSVERYRLPGTGSSDPSGTAPDLLRAFRTQRLYGGNAVFRWRPPLQGLYRSFRWEVEGFGHDGPESLVWGGFTQAQWQAGRRTHLGARFDAVQLPGSQEAEVHGEGVERHGHLHLDEGGDWTYAASGTFTFFPSEFSRFRLAVERTFGEGWDEANWRAVFQTTFSIGPHRPHPF